jgi:hypothetical protein
VDVIPGTVPDQMHLGKKGHLFERIHAKNPYVQVECCEELKCGKGDYQLVNLG